MLKKLLLTLGLFFLFTGSSFADLDTWTQQTSGYNSSINTVSFGNNLYFYGANQGVLATSSDGITWTQRTSSFGTSTIIGSTYGNNFYVIVGQSGKLATSIDGITWTQRTSSFGTTTIYSVVYANGLFVSVGGNGKLATSSDGIAWTQQTHPFSNYHIYTVTYGSGLYVAAGGSGRLMTSSDGINWTLQTSSFGTSEIRSITYGNGLFVAGSRGGKLATSTDGINWTQRTSSFGTTDIWSIIYGNGYFVAVSLEGKLAISADGINWTQKTSSYGVTSIYSITYGNALFVTVGEEGKLAISITTPPLSAPSVPAGPHVTYTPSYTFDVQCVSAGNLYSKVGDAGTPSLISACSANQTFSRTITVNGLGTNAMNYAVESGGQWSSWSNVTITRLAPRNPTIDIDLPLTTHHSSITYNITCTDGGDLYQDGELYQSCSSGQSVQITKPLPSLTNYVWQYDVRQDEYGYTLTIAVNITRREPNAPTIPPNPQEPTSYESFTYDVVCDDGGALYESRDSSTATLLQNCIDAEAVNLTRPLNIGDNSFSYYIQTSDSIQSDHVSFTKYRNSAYQDRATPPIIINTETSQSTTSFTLQVQSTSDNTQIYCDWNDLGYEPIGAIANNGDIREKIYSLVYAGNDFSCRSDNGKVSSDVFFSVNRLDELVEYKAPVLISPMAPHGSYNNKYSIIVESRENGTLYCNNGTLTKNLGTVSRGTTKTYEGELAIGSNTFTCFTRITESPRVNSPFLEVPVQRLVSVTGINAPEFIDSGDHFRTTSNPYTFQVKNNSSGTLYCRFGQSSYSEIAYLSAGGTHSLTYDFTNLDENLSKSLSTSVSCYTLFNYVASQEVETLLNYNPFLGSCSMFSTASDDSEKGVFVSLYQSVFNFLNRIAIIGDFAFINCLVKNDFIDYLDYPTNSSHIMSFTFSFQGFEHPVSVDILGPVTSIQSKIVQQVGQDNYDAFRWITTSMLIFLVLWSIWSSIAFSFKGTNNVLFNRSDL